MRTQTAENRREEIIRIDPNVHNFPTLRRSNLNTLQVNLGYKCNQTCSHCHVNAGPSRTEMMDNENIHLIPSVLNKYNIKTLDLTGGAPELHPQFRNLVNKVRSKGIDVIDRCNLTILSEPGQDDLDMFLAKQKVIITASLPCYEESNVDKQRGKGVFARSIDGLKKLNRLGYGMKDSDLILNLVYNPIGASLPPSQIDLENDYRNILKERYNIYFSSLFTITNMPIKRFAFQLASSGGFDEYMLLLKSAHNPENLRTVMCRETLSVDWQGNLYDCDFNQQLGIKIKGSYRSLKDMANKKVIKNGSSIMVADHCFGCTAGAGSSCGGALDI